MVPEGYVTLDRVGRAHHRCARGLEEYVWRTGVREGEAEVPEAGCCAARVRQRR
jgi:hypothetical protein